MVGEPDESRGWLRDIFFQAEHGLYLVMAALLCVTCLIALAGSGLTIVQALGDWTGTEVVFTVIDRLLVVLMLLEILHTVLVSIRSGVLTAEPFLIVGLIASIRRILVITLETAHHVGAGDASAGAFRDSMIELGVLCVLILVLVTAIVMLRRHREVA